MIRPVQKISLVPDFTRFRSFIYIAQRRVQPKPFLCAPEIPQLPSFRRKPESRVPGCRLKTCRHDKKCRRVAYLWNFCPRTNALSSGGFIDPKDLFVSCPARRRNADTPAASTRGRKRFASKNLSESDTARKFPRSFRCLRRPPRPGN